MNGMQLLEIFTRLIGVELNPSQHSFYSFRLPMFCIYFIGLSAFFVNVWANYYCSVKHKMTTSSQSSYMSAFINYLSFDFFVIGSHAILLSLPLKSEWKWLWKNQYQFIRLFGHKRHPKLDGVVFFLFAVLVLCYFIHLHSNQFISVQSVSRRLLTS